jgi:thiol-disulfide isomerase/thioredoxin
MTKRRILILAIVLLFAAVPLLVTIFHEADEGPPLTGWMAQFTVNDASPPAPETTFLDADGRELRLDRFLGRVVLVNFWASWCEPCIREMPALDRLQGKLGGDEFTVLAINVDRGGVDAARPFLKKLKIAHLSLYLDRRMTLMRGLGVRRLPTSIVVGHDGRLKGRLEGVAEWDTPEVEALIRYYIDR